MPDTEPSFSGHTLTTTVTQFWLTEPYTVTTNVGGRVAITIVEVHVTTTGIVTLTGVSQTGRRQNLADGDQAKLLAALRS